MSETSYDFSFCKSIMSRASSKRFLPAKKGDTIYVPDFIEVGYGPIHVRESTPELNHEKLSNSTVSDFGNSFNSDIKSFLSKAFLN